MMYIQLLVHLKEAERGKN